MPDDADDASLAPLLRWGGVALWMAVIFGLSSLQDPAVPSGMATPGHAALYFVLGALLVEALLDERLSPRAFALAVIAASLYGASDELHQAFVPTRTPDVLDWAWDTLGAAVGAATWWFVRTRHAGRHR